MESNDMKNNIDKTQNEVLVLPQQDRKAFGQNTIDLNLQQTQKLTNKIDNGFAKRVLDTDYMKQAIEKVTNVELRHIRNAILITSIPLTIFLITAYFYPNSKYIIVLILISLCLVIGTLYFITNYPSAAADMYKYFEEFLNEHQDDKGFLKVILGALKGSNT
jgi:hypothetical protein